MVGSSLHALAEMPDVNWNPKICVQKAVVHSILGGLRQKQGFGAALAYHMANNLFYTAYDMMVSGPLLTFVDSYVKMLQTSYGPAFDLAFEGTPIPEVLPSLGEALANP